MRIPRECQEVSGIVAQGEVLWAINDGGNQSVLYKINPKNGAILQRDTLPIPNVDWEEIQQDKSGNLWIGDIGNNSSKRRRLLFYRYQVETGRIDSLEFTYPDQKQFPPATQVARSFDCEAFVWLNDTLHLFTKSRFAGNHFTKHYTIAAKPGVQLATLRDSLYLPKRAVSGAAISPDARTLVLVAYFVKIRKFWLPFTRATAYFVTDYPENNFFSGKIKAKRLPKIAVARQYESVSFLNHRKWIFANEGILWQKPRLWTLRGKY